MYEAAIYVVPTSGAALYVYGPFPDAETAKRWASKFLGSWEWGPRIMITPSQESLDSIARELKADH